MLGCELYLNILQLEQVERKLINDEITSEEAAKLFYTTNGQKPLATNEWTQLHDLFCFI